MAAAAISSTIHAAEAERSTSARIAFVNCSPGAASQHISRPSTPAARSASASSTNATPSQSAPPASAARALASRPEIVFADEPTGNLDSRSGAEVLGFLRRSVDEFGQTIAMVTHDPGAASYADRVLFLADGRIVDEMTDPTAERVLDRMKAFEARAADQPR